ncbi:myosin-11-like isoform X3 [Lytechinus variegatus]|uniref:myosin-11-like isoform X3 n=1 Tax=Lytechinus variegatus TaxID=7654 RepID=UPI001BB1ED37|nr:myosin-11-like isoform X3 [Lytechinus variegatus]
MDMRVRDPGIITSSPVNYEVESSVGFGSNANLDTSFELMSASQLRDQLRREQGKRREKEAEIDVLKRTTGSSLYGGSSTPKSSSPIHSRTYGDHVPSNSQDSDSGISHGGSRKSPYHHLTPPHQSSSLPQVSSHTAYGSHSSAAPTMPRTVRSSPYLSSGYDGIGGGGVLPGGNTSTSGAEFWNTSPSSMKNMKDAMYESEQRRLALVEKLREAHDTLQNQTEKLCNSEGLLNDTHHTLSSLSATNEALQKRLVEVQKERDGSVTDKMDALRQQGLLQQRVVDLEQELKSLRASNSALQAENRKRDVLVDQTSRAMSLLDEENKTFQQTKDTMLKEALALKESIMIAKAKNEKLESEVRELEKLNESREMLAARNTELNAYLMDERRQVAELMHQVDLLKGDFMRASEERDVFQSRAIDLEDKCSDLNARCVSSSASKERLMQEKLDLQQSLNQTMHEKEDLIKIKQDIDSQLTQAQLSVTQHKLMVDKKDEELEKLEEELNATKKVSEVLSTELSLVKNNQERLQEEFKQLNADKRAVTQQQSYWEGEARRIAGERDILTKAMEQLKSDFMKEKDQFEEQLQSHREGTREARSEKTKASARVQELETMLHRANEDLKEATLKQQEEMEEWKGSCDRLSSSVARKENESAALKEKLREASDQISEMRAQIQSLENSVEELSRFKETASELEEENKRLAQEHGEDQQVIQLLEMQKTILSKHQTTGVPKQAAEKLQAEIDHLKAELGLSEDKIEELKEELSRERTPGGYRSARATPIAFDRSADQDDHIKNLKEMNKLLQEKISKLEASLLQQSLRAKAADDTEVRNRDLDEQVRSMNDLNQMLGEKVSRLEKDNAELMIRTPKEDWVPKFDYDTIEKDKIKLEADYEILKAEYAELEARHQKFLQDHLSRTLDSSGLGLSLSNLDRRGESYDLGELHKLRRDNSSLERQVEVLRGQSNLAENGKKRAEDRLRPNTSQDRQIEGELVELQDKMSKEREKNQYIANLEIETILRSQLDEHKQIIKQLQTEVATKNVALENATVGMEERMVDKAREMERVIKERDEHCDARRRLEQEKLVLEIKIKEQKMLLEQLRDEKPRLLQERQGEISTLQEQLMSANKNVRKLENDVRNLEEQLSDKDHQLRRIQLSQSSEIEGMHEEATKQIKELQLQLLKKENEGSEMRQELNRREDEMRQVLQGKTKQELELEQIRGEAGRTVEHLTSIVEKQESEIIRLKSEVENKMEELKRLRTAQENDVESLKEMLSDTNKKYSRLKEEKEMNETELQHSMTRQLQDLRREIDRKEQLIKNMSEELEEERMQKPKLKESMNEVEDELMSVRAELARVNGTIKIKETQIQDQDNQLRESHDKYDNLMREKMDLKRRLDSLQDNADDELRDLRKKLDTQKNELTILEDMNRAMEGKSEDSNLKVKRYEDKVKGLQEEIGNLNRMVNNLQSRNKRLEESKDNLIKDMDTLRDEKSRCSKCSRLESQYQEVLTEKENLEEDNEELHKEVENLNNLLTLKQKDAKESQKVKESPLKRTPNSTLALERSQTSSRASPISSTTPSPKPGSGRAATPQQLAAALKRLSVKQSPQGGAAGGGGGDEKRALSPEPKDRKGLKDLGKVSGYEDRRKSLNSMESRLQALRSSQDKTIKDMKKPAVKPDLNSTGGSGDGGKKQARFVLPSSKKFEKSLGSTGGSSRSKPPMDDNEV